jgi:cytosine/adenosine deaminase-related metal-dependent hydrolase
MGDGDNNLVVLDYQPPTPVHQNNFVGHFLFGLEASHVKHVISKGKLIVKERQVTTVNEAVILAEARKQAERLWKAMG